MRIIGTYNSYYNAQTNFQAAKITPSTKQWNELRVFSHHIYEYKKGLRNLILTTEKEANRAVIINRLEKENIFFGNPDCISVIRSFNQPKLNQYTPEQDFILGTLLGYDKIQQCQRYMKMIKK